MSFDVLQWFASVSGPDWIWYAKYLSANDTAATGGHQVGLYIPRMVFGQLFPTAASSRALNPSHILTVTIVSEGRPREVRAIWYNNKVVGRGTRDECRITRWGGSRSPIQDPEATGSLCVFAFRLGATRDAEEGRVWLCRDLAEEQVALDWLGLVEPGAGVLLSPTGHQLLDITIPERDTPCILRRDQIPTDWLQRFPDAADLVALSIRNLPTARNCPPDERLVRRRDCEYQLFRSVEETHVLPKVTNGFESVEAFISYANAVTNRRKSRSGTSLELQVRAIFDEGKLSYSHDEVSEGGKRPDFLFPSADKYRDSSWPTDKLRMLAVKTTCKDRWRQVLDEAGRLRSKHLLTLQEGVSVNQFRQMDTAGVQLVVPERIHRAYPAAVRARLLSLGRFMEETRATCRG